LILKKAGPPQGSGKAKETIVTSLYIVKGSVRAVTVIPISLAHITKVLDGNTMTPSVTVNANANSPAAHKVCSGSTCYFEAIVSKPNPTVFYRAFLSIWKRSTGSAFTVAARAVAGTPGNATGCLYLTDPKVPFFKPMATTRSMRPVAAYMLTRQTLLQ
jgi:hypothetical protein